MRILFVGETIEGSRSPQRIAALRRLGHDVRVISTTPAADSYERTPSLAERIAYRLRVPIDRAGVNAAMGHVAPGTFDAAFFDNAKVLRADTLRALKARNSSVPLIWFSEDDMMNPRHRPRGLTRALPLFDLCVTTKSFNADPAELPRLGARRVLFVHNSYDPELHRPVAVSAEERQRWGADVAFVGTFERPRAASLLQLADAGLTCRIWGNGWESLANRHRNVVVEKRPVYGADYARVLCSSRINLCFLRHFNRDRQTTRSIEIPACGAFMLHESSAEMSALLRADREAAYFVSDDELTAACRRWLGEDAGRARIAAAGRERVLALGLSHGDTLTRILDAAGCPA